MGPGSDGFDAKFSDRNYLITQQSSSNTTFGNGVGKKLEALLTKISTEPKVSIIRLTLLLTSS